MEKRIWIMTLNIEGCKKYLIVLLPDGEVVRADSMHNEVQSDIITDKWEYGNIKGHQLYEILPVRTMATLYLWKDI